MIFDRNAFRIFPLLLMALLLTSVAWAHPHHSHEDDNDHDHDHTHSHDEPMMVDDYHQLPARPFQMIRGLPLNPEFYQPEVAELVEAGIPEKYGAEEWTAIIFTNELHQHIGIYNIVGAKMGVFARELLRAPTRAIHVDIETGPHPPLSCTIDGIQWSLGSTYGQALIDAPETDAPRVAATFTHEDDTLHLALKPEFQARIGTIIQEAIEEHGNLTPAYFDEIEAASYTIWREFDRKEIFEVSWR